MSFIRENWRVTLLTIFIAASLFALFIPGGVIADGDAALEEDESVNEGFTNIKYGLELSGGTRLRAPVVGMTAENVEYNFSQQAQIEQTVANELGISVTDVLVRPQEQTVEVFSKEPTHAEFAAALQTAGVDATEENVRSGVTEQTRSDMVRVIESKVNEAGLSGGKVQEVTTGSGDHFIVVEMPNVERAELKSLLEDRGAVEVVAYYPEQTDNGTVQRNETALERDDFSRIGTAQPRSDRMPAHVPVTVTDEKASEFQQQMNDNGFTSSQGIRNCNYEQNPENGGHCLLTVVDGEVVYSANMGSDLAQTLRSGQFEDNPTFIMTATNLSEARNLQIHLRAGALPAPLDIDDRGTSFYLSPSQADEFKFLSLLTGIIATLAVVAMVFFRYGDPKVAVPMLLTAGSEVIILLGFASAIQMPLDLSHIAGLIAVIGTGVDDLIIIADEVMSEGEVRSDRVFQSRFRKAFWVIGAAAATTIVAMSPLAVLSLGDLRGFAIITILGVLIGVLVTRPAYGDIIRALLTKF